MRQQTRSCTSCTNKFTNKISPLLTFRWPSWEQILSPAANSSFSGNLVEILVVMIRFISVPASTGSVAGADNTVRIASSAIAFVVAQSTSALVSSKNLAKDYACHSENAQLIPKTIGNRKRDCAWGCARGLTPPEKICRSKSTNQSGERNERRPDLCFSICRFSQVVFIPRAQPHAQSLFPFPIVFGINLVHFFDEKKDGAAGNSKVCFGASIPCHAIWQKRRRMRTVSKSATYLRATEGWTQRHSRAESEKKVQIFGKEKCKTHHQFQRY